jgi:hypothetical protein
LFEGNVRKEKPLGSRKFDRGSTTQPRQRHQRPRLFGSKAAAQVGKLCAGTLHCGY